MAEKKAKVPYSRKPAHLSVDEWQLELRKQFATGQKFKFKNLGDHLVYSDFEVYNPDSGNTYKVAIRDNKNSFNYCSCPDFTINGLGTCKHVEYLLHYFSKYKKYQRHLRKPYIPTYSSLSIFYGNERNIRLEKAHNSPVIPNEKSLFDKHGFLKNGNLKEIENFIETAKNTDPEFRIYPDVYSFINHHKKQEDNIRHSRKLFDNGTESAIFNGLIRANLYNYQKQGVQRIIETGRILLADEMGLGKTIQALAATEILSNYFGVKKVLIICPTSLKYQWKREIEKFTDRDCIVVEGLIHKRKTLYKQNVFYKIISYGVCRNDLEFINEWNADLVIIDEAQRIKNWKTQTAQSVKKIVTEFAIVLTGTPLENRIDELHSIIEYIDRYKLGPLFRFLNNHQILDEYGKLKGYKNLRDINESISDILLRRTKKEIADQLPGRIDKNFFVEMTREQRTDHQDYYDIVSRLVNKWIKTGSLTEEEREKLLMMLNCMRMVCDSTYILNQDTNHQNKVDEIADLLQEITENEDNKVVIFSQWKRMFELIIKELDKLKVPYVYLNGDIPAVKRKEIIEKFQESNEIKIFLSTDAGGVGVNLQSANIMINVDIPWNPAVLEQRIGRIYRLGQKKTISVFNFISKGSIEHRILHLLDFKKSVFAGVLEEEGKDQVLMDSFLESVKALTEVNLEESSVKSYREMQRLEQEALPLEQKQQPEHNFEHSDHPVESNLDTKPESHANQSPTNKEPSKKIGLFSRIGRAVKNIMKKWF